MEGPKSFAEKPQRAETGESIESIESLAESIKRAHELLAELKKFDGVEMVGGEAMTLNRQAEELACELEATLEQIPAQDCRENNLPYHPSDKKPAVPVTPFPKSPGYPLGYRPGESADHSMVDDEQHPPPQRPPRNFIHP